MNPGAKYRDEDTLRQICSATAAVGDFCNGLTYDTFQRDTKTWSATAYQVLAIGEAAHRISAEFAAQHTNIPWREMKAMRHILAHGYDIVRLDILWQTATQDLPQLQAQIERLLDAQHNDHTTQ